MYWPSFVLNRLVCYCVTESCKIRNFIFFLRQMYSIHWKLYYSRFVFLNVWNFNSSPFLSELTQGIIFLFIPSDITLECDCFWVLIQPFYTILLLFMLFIYFIFICNDLYPRHQTINLSLGSQNDFYCLLLYLLDCVQLAILLGIKGTHGCYQVNLALNK